MSFFDKIFTSKSKNNTQQPRPESVEVTRETGVVVWPNIESLYLPTAGEEAEKTKKALALAWEIQPEKLDWARRVMSSMYRGSSTESMVGGSARSMVEELTKVICKIAFDQNAVVSSTTGKIVSGARESNANPLRKMFDGLVFLGIQPETRGLTRLRNLWTGEIISDKELCSDVYRYKVDLQDSHPLISAAKFIALGLTAYQENQLRIMGVDPMKDEARQHFLDMGLITNSDYLKEHPLIPATKNVSNWNVWTEDGKLKGRETSALMEQKVRLVRVTENEEVFTDVNLAELSDKGNGGVFVSLNIVMADEKRWTKLETGTIKKSDTNFGPPVLGVVFDERDAVAEGLDYTKKCFWAGLDDGKLVANLYINTRNNSGEIRPSHLPVDGGAILPLVLGFENEVRTREDDVYQKERMFPLNLNGFGNEWRADVVWREPRDFERTEIAHNLGVGGIEVAVNFSKEFASTVDDLVKSTADNFDFETRLARRDVLDQIPREHVNVTDKVEMLLFPGAGAYTYLLPVVDKWRRLRLKEGFKRGEAEGIGQGKSAVGCFLTIDPIKRLTVAGYGRQDGFDDITGWSVTRARELAKKEWGKNADWQRELMPQANTTTNERWRQKTTKKTKESIARFYRIITLSQLGLSPLFLKNYVGSRVERTRAVGGALNVEVEQMTDIGAQVSIQKVSGNVATFGSAMPGQNTTEMEIGLTKETMAVGWKVAEGVGLMEMHDKVAKFIAGEAPKNETTDIRLLAMKQAYEMTTGKFDIQTVTVEDLSARIKTLRNVNTPEAKKIINILLDWLVTETYCDLTKELVAATVLTVNTYSSIFEKNKTKSENNA